MALLGMLLSVHLMSTVLVAIEASSSDPPQAKPGCLSRCGDITIPYPFGIGDECYLREAFNITCDESVQPPRALLADSSIIATNISLNEGELRIWNTIAHDCYDDQGNQTESMRNFPSLRLNPPFTISARNKFVAVGCDTSSIFTGNFLHPYDDKRYSLTCISACSNLAGAVNGSCAKPGCCQYPIHNGLQNFTLTLGSFFEYKDVEWNFKRCSYSFIVEEGQFIFFPDISFQELSKTRQLPMILDWEIQNGGCVQAQKRQDYACKGISKCVNRTIDLLTETIGYYCQCPTGFEGNPYLSAPGGCRDINECMAPTNPCNNDECINLEGSYRCSCRKGFRNKDPQTCIQNSATSKNKSLKISLGVSFGFSILLVVIIWIHWDMNKRRMIKLKEKYFKENGGLMLQQQLARYGGRVDPTRIFTAEELEKATNNYHESRVLGEGGYGTVYKGTLPDNKMVAIKKSKVAARTQNDQFVNEVIFLSQIHHRNVVRLLGCCFETEVPLLVYEYITNDTLFEHLFNRKGKRSSLLPWEMRLKIAAETAGALAYLHSSTSTPIIHRDVKTTNILLDENYTAKVSDFGASRFIPLDQIEVATLVQGTMGYLDPEYLQTNTLTEKSDVYSFGVVLAELLTSKVALSFARPESERSLAHLFASSIEKQCLMQILDADMVNEENVETIEQVANVAKICLRLKGEERPTMKEVAAELDGMRSATRHPWKNDIFCAGEETEYLLGRSPNSKAYLAGEGEVFSSGSTSRYANASMQREMLKSYDDGR